MLYRYPVEQVIKHETLENGRRYDRYTGEDLPPVPYINTVKSAATPVSGGWGTSAKSNVTKNSTAKNNTNTAKTVKTNSSKTTPQQSAQSELDKQKALLLRQQQEALEKYYADSLQKLKSNYEAQQQAAQLSSDDIMRQLYVAYMQGIKNMSQQQAIQGAGGEIESLKSRHRTNYENNRAKQNLSHSGVLSELQQRYNDDLMELEANYLRQLMGL